MKYIKSELDIIMLNKNAEVITTSGDTEFADDIWQ